MPAGAIAQLSVLARRRPGIPGMLLDVSRQHDVDVLINSDPQAAELYTLVIDTATNSEEYGVNLTAPVDVSVSYTADGSTSAAEISAGLADAWNESPLARAIAEADGTTTTGTVTFTGVYPGVAFTMEEDENAGKMTLTNTTDAAEADTVPFGRAMVSTSYTTGEPDALGVLAKSTALTAQVDTWTLVYDAGVEVSIVIEVDGETYESTPFAMATDLATACAALDVAVDAAMPANTVVATSTATTVVLTAELAGKPFKSWVRFGVGRDTGAATKSSNESTPSTNFNRVFAGVSLWTYDEQQLDPSTEASEYAKNAGVEVLRRGDVWVENTQTLTAHSRVYVELDGTGANAGKFYNTSSSTRVLVDAGLLSWLRSDAAGSDADVAALRVNL